MICIVCTDHVWYKETKHNLPPQKVMLSEQLEIKLPWSHEDRLIITLLLQMQNICWGLTFVGKLHP